MELALGRTQTLTVLRSTRTGHWLGRDGEELALLPHRLAAPDDEELPDLSEGDDLEVFVYLDAEGRPTATRQQPAMERGELACLTVVDVTEHGAFLDWGLDKDLFLPFGEMHDPVRPGDRVVVGLDLGARGRLVASARMNRVLEGDPRELQVGQPVKALVYGWNDHGALVAVQRRHVGMIHDSELHRRVRIGDEVSGYVKEIRRDRKVEMSLLPPGGRERVDAATQKILDALAEEGGRLMLHDKSPPDAIAARLRMSKKAFKKAVGGLYRQRRIRFIEGGIESVEHDG